MQNQWKMKQMIFLARPHEALVSGVESGAARGTVMWDKLRGWEGVWLRDKLWCTMEVLIFDRSPDLLKLPRGLGFRLPKGLLSPGLLRSLSLLLSFCLSFSLTSCICLSYHLLVTASYLFSLCCPCFEPSHWCTLTHLTKDLITW